MKAIFTSPEKSIKISSNAYLYLIYFVMMLCLVFITQTGYSQSTELTNVFNKQNKTVLELTSMAEMNTDFYTADKTNAEQNIDRATFVGNDLIKNYIVMLSQIENQLNRNYFVKMQSNHIQIIELRLDKANIMVADKL